MFGSLMYVLFFVSSQHFIFEYWKLLLWDTNIKHDLDDFQHDFFKSSELGWKWFKKSDCFEDGKTWTLKSNLFGIDLWFLFNRKHSIFVVVAKFTFCIRTVTRIALRAKLLYNAGRERTAVANPPLESCSRFAFRKLSFVFTLRTRQLGAVAALY